MEIKASKEESTLLWKVLVQYQPYHVNIKRFLLCLNEKLQIAIYKGNNMLNKGREIISKCRYRGTNIPWQVMIACTETLNEKLKIIEIFEICGNLIYFRCKADWQKLHLIYIIFQIQHKSRSTPLKDDRTQTIQVSSFAYG